MATYTYRCRECDSFDIVQPMSSVQPTHACPGCGADAKRVNKAPSLAVVPRDVARAVDTAQASAEAPQVVRSSQRRATSPLAAVESFHRRQTDQRRRTACRAPPVLAEVLTVAVVGLLYVGHRVVRERRC